MSLQPLGPEDRALLLAVARAAIRDRVSGGRSVDAVAGRASGVPALAIELGAFVTLKSVDASDGTLRLRGCMGTIEPNGPLHTTVARCAGDSACADPRFPAVAATELDALVVQVSVIGPVGQIDGVDAIVPGRHGVILTKARHRALFLPQVAIEQRWSGIQLLEHLALKAGLKSDDWRAASLAVFETQNF